MDRRSGLKKAHFSSVPTRMSLFTCKKYVFLIGKTQHNALYESRCGVGDDRERSIEFKHDL
ncbi:hypothetical protein LIMHP_04405 [Leptospira interrogans serovar Manilae]|nr:hypothetical protein LIMLP_04420 [Leptospira interrogans serovar Manilae]AKP29052.1 hypothetical protein LIMHP_04405 [Leptospira interrogans serovar Manilae]